MPTPQVIPPIVDPHLPSLTLHLDLGTEPVAVGDTAVFTLTVSNQAPDPADELLVTLATPDGALAISGPNTVSPTRGWSWGVAHLDAMRSVTLTGSLRLVRMPAGDALLLRPQATARGFSAPVRDVGGALAIDRAHGLVTAPFRPGTAAVLRSADGHLSIALPPHAAARRLTLRHQRQANPLKPRSSTGFGRSFGVFSLDATDDQGVEIHQFGQPLMISLSYTPEQLQALGIAEDDLTLFWFDPQRNQWVPISTSVDPKTRTASAVVDHFSDYEFGDASSPSTAYLPSLQGWQVGLYTGAATYDYPIDVPAGAGGLKPNVSLSYSSAAMDGASGKRQKQQSSWVGRGWSLDTGSIALNKVTYSSNGNNYSYYSDTVNESSESFTATLSNPANATLGALTTATVTIQDNDAIPSVSWGSSSFSVAEAIGTAFLSVQLNIPSSNPVTVAFATSNGTAVAGISPSGDYTAAGYTITFAPGEVDKTVRVSITSDANPEPNETINLALSSPTNATLGTPASAVLTIIDDDAAPPPQPPNGYDILATYDTIGNLNQE